MTPTEVIDGLPVKFRCYPRWRLFIYPSCGSLAFSADYNVRNSIALIAGMDFILRHCLMLCSKARIRVLIANFRL